jgi:uroporphyrinogen decarboxylase
MSDSAPNFERLRKALLLQGEPDRVPLLELDVARDVKRAFLGSPGRGLAAEVEFWVKAGYDHIPIAQGIGMVITGRVQAHDAAGTAFSGVMRRGESQYSLYQQEATGRWWMEESRGVISSVEEFESFPWPDAASISYSLLDRVAELLPPGMKIIPLLSNTFPQVSALMGTENFFLSIYQNPELVARMFHKIGSIEYEALKQVVKHPAVGAIWLVGDIAYSEGLLVSPQVLRQYFFPVVRKMVELCRERDLPCIFHSDGRLYEVIDDLIDCGINALHPIEPKAMDIAYLKQKYGEKLCLCGNIDLAYTLTLGTPEEVVEEVKQRLRQIAPGGGYCAGSSNSVTEYVPLANYNAMRETVLKYGTYPISV